VRAITGYDGARRTILVVDDKLYNRLVLRDLLDPLGFVVYTAEDGQQAIDKAVELRPDAIVMDLVMPVKTGIEAVREIRQHPEFHDVPIIAVSASVLEAEQEKSRVAGCNAFLPKPINTARLLDVLAAYLKLSWIYAEPEVAAEARLVPPPAEELAVLAQLANDGQILKIQTRAVRLEQLDETYVPAARQLQQLAQRFEIEQIKELVHHWMEENHHEQE
jgi:CheY-like chemotaxis protein